MLLLITIASLIFQGNYCISQSRWIRTYHTGEDVPFNFVIESYDRGYLLLGKHGANYSKYNWLIKTDINGEIIWEKTIGNGINSIVFLDMDQDSSGNTYLGGSTKAFDPSGDPIIMKLNPCGEKEWCRVFYTDNNHDFSSCLTLTPSGEVVAELSLTNPDPFIDRICLAKLSPEGELLWKKCYTTTDTSQRNEEIYDLIFTPDHGFLVNGWCYYEDPFVPSHWLPHPYFLKIDSLGNFEWETVVFKETNLDGGVARSIVVSPDSKSYYSSINHYRYDTIMISPALVKIDLQGNLIDVCDIVSGYKYGSLTYAQFLNDSTLAAEAGWGNIEDSVWSRAVIIDTLGNLLNSKVLVQDLYTSILQVTYDGKLLYASNTYQNNQFNAFLTKLNQNLEDDTIYIMPYTYDSLCPYPIVSDTIDQNDCGLIVGIEEPDNKGLLEGESVGLEAWPNPARTSLQFAVVSAEALAKADGSQQSAVSSQLPANINLIIYDLFGRKVKEIGFPAGNNEIKLDVSDYTPGLYFAVARRNNKALGSAKFLVVK